MRFLHFGEPGAFRQLEHRRRLIGGHRPDHGGPGARQHRQQRERTADIEDFIGGVGVRHFMVDRGDHGGVLILPAGGVDARRLARGAVAPFRRDQQCAVDRRAILQRQGDAIGITIDMDGTIGLEDGEVFDLGRGLRQRDAQVAIGEHRPHHAIIRVRHEIERARIQPVADPDTVDRAALAFQMRANADRLKHGEAGRTDRRDTAVETGGRGLHGVGRIDHGALHAMARKSDAQGEANQAPAKNDDVEALHGHLSRRLRAL